MKTRSKALFDYLLKAGVLNGTPEQIACAKLAYRKQYKRNWKLQKRSRKELRIEVTTKQFAVIKQRAQSLHVPHTTYARTVLLASIDAYPIFSRDTLLQLLQLISMSVTATAHDTALQRVHIQLLEAETILLDHISKSRERV